MLEVYSGLGVPDEFFESCLLEHGHLCSGQTSEKNVSSSPQQSLTVSRFVEKGVAS